MKKVLGALLLLIGISPFGFALVAKYGLSAALFAMGGTVVCAATAIVGLMLLMK